MSRLFIVTGTSRGLGQALFDLLSNANSRIIAISLNYPDYQKEIRDRWPNIKLLIHDLSRPEKLEDLFVEIEDSLDNVKEVVFINNAGVVKPIKAVGEIENIEAVSAININYLSPILLINELVLICQKHSLLLRIINISSGAALRPLAGWAMYCSTKAATKMFLDVLRVEQEIEVTHFDPGVMNTTMQKEIRENKFPTVNYFQNLKAEGRLREPKEVAEEIINKFIEKK